MATTVTGKSTAAAKPAAPRRQITAQTWRAGLTRAGLLIVFLAVWELISRLGLVNHLFLPPPSELVSATGEMLGERRAIYGFQMTAYRLFWSCLLGTGFGVVVGLILGLSKVLRLALLPPILFVLSTPKAVFLPIFLAIFGLGTEFAIAYGVFSAFFYVVDSVVGGVDLLDERHRRLAKAFKAPMRYFLVDVLIPAAGPGIFAGVWHGLRQALAAVLVAELFSSDAGIGYMIRAYTNQFRADKTLAIVVVISVISIIVGVSWNRLEARMNRWRSVMAG